MVLYHSKGFDELWVSTEDKEIAEEALKYEANVHQRPASVAEDNTSSILAVQEFVERHPGQPTLCNFNLKICQHLLFLFTYVDPFLFIFTWSSQPLSLSIFSYLFTLPLPSPSTIPLFHSHNPLHFIDPFSSSSSWVHFFFLNINYRYLHPNDSLFSFIILL